MRSITSTLPPHGFADSFPFPNLDPALQQPQQQFLPPSPPMDLQYILSPSAVPDDAQQQQPPPPQQRPHPPLIFQDKHQLVPQPVPSSSRTTLPTQHVHPNPDDSIISFDGETRSFPKRSKASPSTVADPYAEGFLRDMLGQDNWETFSTRLFERRLGAKSKGKGKAKQGDPKSGVSAIEFLVKVEVVKSILRECVPHPYNPRKSLSHPYPPAPTGHVTLTRSTVLLLCGWSNTQFSYWARRSEAVSVLGQYDPRLRAVASALERRLRGSPRPAPEDEDEGAAVTGKGLEAIIEEVKGKTHMSGFLRGKHSSLDPFGTVLQDPAAPPPPPQYAMPTFQANDYDHERRAADIDTPSGGPLPPPASPPHLRLAPVPAPPISTDSRETSTPVSTTQFEYPASASVSTSSSQQPSPSPRATRAATRKAADAADNSAHHFPVSDSRSEVENPATQASAKRKASDDAGEPSSKRARTSKETS